MKTIEVVAALAGLTEEQVNTIVEVVNNTRLVNSGLASLEPAKKRRGRKPGVKNTPKPAPAKALVKGKAKKARKSSDSDTFSE